MHTIPASGYSAEGLIVQVQLNQDASLVHTPGALCWNAFQSSQPLAWSGHCLPGPETIALTDVTGSFISALLMLILSYAVNVCAINYFTAQQKHFGAGLETAAKPTSQSSFGTSSTRARDEPPLYLNQERANCNIGAINFPTPVFFCFL